MNINKNYIMSACLKLLKIKKKYIKNKTRNIKYYK